MKDGYYITADGEKTELLPPTKGNKTLDVSNRNIKELVVPEEVRYVSCKNNQLTSLELPKGVKTVWCDISVKLINLNGKETEAILYA